MLTTFRLQNCVRKLYFMLSKNESISILGQFWLQWKSFSTRYPPPSASSPTENLPPPLSKIEKTLGRKLYKKSDIFVLFFNTEHNLKIIHAKEHYTLFQNGLSFIKVKFIKKLSSSYKLHAWSPLQILLGANWNMIFESQKELFLKYYYYYMQFSAFQLYEIKHIYNSINKTISFLNNLKILEKKCHVVLTIIKVGCGAIMSTWKCIFR